jgi:hypothetical protein
MTDQHSQTPGASRSEPDDVDRDDPDDSGHSRRNFFTLFLSSARFEAVVKGRCRWGWAMVGLMQDERRRRPEADYDYESELN